MVKILVNISDLEETTPYTLKISYDGYLEYENQFIPEEIEEKNGSYPHKRSIFHIRFQQHAKCARVKTEWAYH